MEKIVIYESEYAKNEFVQSVNENLCIIMLSSKDTYKDLLTYLPTVGVEKPVEYLAGICENDSYSEYHLREFYNLKFENALVIASNYGHAYFIFKGQDKEFGIYSTETKDMRMSLVEIQNTNRLHQFKTATSEYFTYALGFSAKIEFVAKKYEHHPFCGYKAAKYSEEYPANKFCLVYGNGGKREKISSACSLRKP